MRILVTGGSGRVGRYVVAELAAAGHTVTNADLTRHPDLPGSYLRVDLTDPGDVYQALAYTRADAVVHLGAWPDAGIVPNSRTYGDNARGAYHIFQACADLGIHRVINASSAQVYGFAAHAPLYAPIDEDHPLRPINAYALAKCAAEQAADYFVRNHHLTILSFRLMGIRTPAQLGPEIAHMAAHPETGAWLLWTRTDARDVGLACRLALEAADVPPGPYNITGARVALSTPSRDLIARYFGSTEIRDLADHASPLSCARAAAAFGYHPRYTWHEDQHHPDHKTS